MKDANQLSVSVGTLLARLGSDRFRIPLFQRQFEWDHEDVRQLIRSLFNDYFIGSVLLWRADEVTQGVLDCEPIYGLRDASAPSVPPISTHNSDDEGYPPVVVLDGQQRLTAMHYAFSASRATLGDRKRPDRFFVDIAKFLEDDPEDPDRNAAFVRRLETDRDRAWDDRRAQRDPLDTGDGIFPYVDAQQHEFPLRLLINGEEADWLLGYRRFWERKARDHQTAADEHKRREDEYIDRADKLDAETGNSGGNGSEARHRARLREAAEQAQRVAADAAQRVSNSEARLEELQANRRKLVAQLKQASRVADQRKIRDELYGRLLIEITEVGKDLESQRRTERQAREAATARTERATTQAVDRDPVHATDQDSDELLRRAEEEAAKYVKERTAAKEATTHAENGARFQEHIRRLTASYMVPVIELEDYASDIAVSDMFSQLNRRGRSLKAFSLLNARMSLLQIPIQQMVDEVLKPRMETGGLWANDRALDDLVRVMLLRTHPDSKFDLRRDESTYESLIPGRPTRLQPGNEVMLVKTKEEFHRHWNAAQVAYESGLQALRDEGHYGSVTPSTVREFVPSEGILPVYCCLLTEGGDAQSRKRVHQWYWASVLTERYSSNVPTRGSLDYQQVRSWCNDGTQVPDAVRHLEERFWSSLFPRESLWSRPGVRTPGLVRAVQILMYVLQPQSWRDGKPYVAKDVSPSEIVPLEWCRNHRIDDSQARSVFNQVLVDRKMDRLIGERPPNAYLAEALEGHSPNAMREILESHCISDRAHDILRRDNFGASDLEEFLKEREAEFLRRIATEVFAGLNL